MKVSEELEEGRGWIYKAKEETGGYLLCRYQITEIVKREAVRLEQRFWIANRWCSLIAISRHGADDREDYANPTTNENSSLDLMASFQSSDDASIGGRTHAKADKVMPEPSNVYPGPGS